MLLIDLEFASSAEYTNLGRAFVRPINKGATMKNLKGPRRRRSQAGVALLIAIFVLLLIGVTAIALILSSGAESALAGNYRSSASVYYAALAGIEEARGRLLPSNPDYFGAFVAPPGTQLPLGQVRYILNPLPGEIVDPTNLGNPSTYPDTEYQKEFGTPITGAAVQTVNSVSPAAGLPGPLYKWVRINAVTEQSLSLDVDLKHSPSTLDSTTPLYYDSACADASPANPAPSLCLNHSPNAVQALEITALASLPNGSQKLLQYVVAPVSFSLNFAPGSSGQGPPAALTLLGNNVSFTGPNSAQFQVNGNDRCSPPSAVYGIGYTNGIASNPNQGAYLGAGNFSPNIVDLRSVPPNMQTPSPSDLDNLVQTITQNADAVINVAPGQIAEETRLPPAMLSGTPGTVVVDGNFDIGNTSTGTGTLVVTGTFSYDRDSSWNGVILVIGQGNVVSNDIGTTNGKIEGAILVAKTRDSSGNLLPALGPASFTSNLTNGGLGIYYNSCLIRAAEKPLTYKVLSYHQLSQ